MAILSHHNLKTMSIKTALYIGFCLIYSTVFSQVKQEYYTLDDCLTMALENNLDLRSSVLNANRANINFKQSKANLLPTLNGNYNIGVNNGRSIDPFTNDFSDQKLTFSNLGLNLNARVFNGFRLLNTVKQQSLNKKASDMEIEEAKQTLTLNVVLAYLQVLNSQDVLALAKQRIVTTEKQYKRQEDLFKEEVGNPADFADIKGQKTIDETSILVAESALKNAKLNLMQLLNLNSDVAIEISDVLLNLDPYKLSSDEVFKDALANLSTFKARELRLEASKKGVSVAKAQFTPDISLFGQLNTNYSSLAETFTETGSRIIDTGDFITFEGQDIPVRTNQPEFRGTQIEYLEQFDNNLNTVVGISVQLPLFNGFRAKNNVALEKVKVAESMVALEQTRQQIKTAIDQVHYDMEIAYKRYGSLQKQVDAFEESFRVNEIRFNNGASNFLGYVTSKNNLENAKTNLANAKYEYILRVKILEFYRGNIL